MRSTTTKSRSSETDSHSGILEFPGSSDPRATETTAEPHGSKSYRVSRDGRHLGLFDRDECLERLGSGELRIND